MGYPANATPELGDDQQLTLKKILLALTGGGSGGPIGLTDAQLRAAAVPVSQAAVTQAASVIVPQSTSQVIPIGAKEWTVSVLTGTATVNGAAGCPAGFSDGSDKTLLNTVTITTAASSTAYVRWAT